MLKIFQASLQQYMNWELPDVQAGFRKGRETRDQIANICWIIEKESFSWGTMKIKKTLESPLDYKEIQPVHPKGDQS